mmetsp:Transcript_1430/g.1502  ORF Transcript_1430/g.1502 Transcript_1430/m.1502 type:complete len:121 (+) Transcript_1430:188-550(+)
MINRNKSSTSNISTTKRQDQAGNNSVCRSNSIIRIPSSLFSFHGQDQEQGQDLRAGEELSLPSSSSSSSLPFPHSHSLSFLLTEVLTLLNERDDNDNVMTTIEHDHHHCSIYNFSKKQQQ